MIVRFLVFSLSMAVASLGSHRAGSLLADARVLAPDKPVPVEPSKPAPNDALAPEKPAPPAPVEPPAEAKAAPAAPNAADVGAGERVKRSEPAKKGAKVKPALPPKWVDAFKWRSIGPANMGGRMTALAVFESDPTVWWVATASGGLLKTVNNGITFEHQFDHETTVSIGDVAVAQSDQKIVWVGTGEANPRNSVSWGDGVYKSTDGGKTWKNMGLKESFQIGRIAIHPTDPNIVYVGALGRLWGPNEERGLYKTIDGGETWEKILCVDDQTGVIDVQMKPDDPDTLLAATYERQRDGFDTNDPAKKLGLGSGLYKSTDGGETWEKLSQGLPTGKLGRIGIDFYRKNPDTVFVVLESERIAQEPPHAPFAGLRGENVEVGAKLTEITKGGPAEKAELKAGDIVVSVDDVTVHTYDELVSEIRKHSAGDTAKFELSRENKTVIVDVTLAERPKPETEEEEDETETPESIARAQQRSPFSSGLGGQRENVHQQQGSDGYEYGGLYKSTDGGETWARINSVNPRPMYFSQVRVDPTDETHVYVLGVSLYRSKDGGVTFTGDGGNGVHPDHHAMWIDPKDGRHMILGNDGGLYVTQDRMEKWDQLNHMAIGQFYHVGVSPQRDYRVYGGLQDNGSWGGPSIARYGDGPLNDDWFRVGGGDGFICHVDPQDADQVYYASQNGGLGRYNLRTGERDSLRPRPERGLKYRWNWKTPFILSNHNSQIYYTAANYVFRSLDRGREPKRISPEITRTDRGSATALAESPKDSDVVYVGTDDGALWITKDAGHEWKKLVDFPPDEPVKKEGASTEDVGGPEEKSPDAESAKPRETDRPSPAGGALLERIMRRDTNGDGKIQRDEASERWQALFDRLDANGDGELDREELEAMPRLMPRGRPPRDAAPPQSDAGASESRAVLASDRTDYLASNGAEPAPPAKDDKLASEPRPKRPERGDTGVSEPAESQGATKKDAASAEKPADETPAPVSPDDPITGEWSVKAFIPGMTGNQSQFNFVLKMSPEGKVTGTMISQMGERELAGGRFNKETKSLTFAAVSDTGSVDVRATVVEGVMNGTAEFAGGGFSFDFEGTRKGAEGDEETKGPKYDWKPLMELLPGPRWVSSIETSRAEAGRCYVTFDGHRSDDDEPYVFVTEDFGKGWRSLRANLPERVGSTKVIREDVANPNILYLGTEFGAWVTIDRGTTWTKFNNNLPTVAVHEFAVHPTAGEIVAATHGRSLWVLDVTPLRQMAEDTLKAKAYVFTPNTAIYWRPEPSRGGGGARRFIGENPGTGTQVFYAINEPPADIRLEITDLSGRRIRELTVDAEPGLHRVDWDLRHDPPRGRTRDAGRGARRAGFGGGRGNRGRLVESGKYLVALTIDDDVITREFRVKTDPEYPDYRPWEMEELEEQDEEAEPEAVPAGTRDLPD